MGGLGLGGMAAGMGVDLGATGSKAVRQHMPAVEAQMLDRASKAAEPAIRYAPEAGRIMRDEEAQRENIPNPNSGMMSPTDRIDLQSNMAKKLQMAKIPRNSEAIQANPRLLKYKLAQNAEAIVSRKMAAAGLDPASMPEEVRQAAESFYGQAELLLNESPEDIPAILPMWTKQMPELFEKDRYNRIDNVVPASMRQDVSEEIRKSGRHGTKKSTHEMIAELDELHSTGKYLG